MSELQQTVDAVWRMEAAKIIATLTRAVGDVGIAEDVAQEALVDALTQWPSSGVPRNPGAWLTTVAKRKEHPLSMRLPEADIAVIDRAAALRGSSRTDFVREAAVRAAEEVVLEQTLLRMSDEGFAAFMAAVTAPAAPVPELALLFRQTGDPERCIAMLREIVATTPEYLPARTDLAETLRGLGRHDEAQAVMAEVPSTPGD